jgi:hypothetical protein
MKKLMIAAAAIAAGAGVYAATLDAQVYDFSLTAKTTACKDIKYTKTIARLQNEVYSDVKKEQIAVRKPATTKIAGVIWGCDCETIADPQWRLYRGGKTVGGYLFWNVGAEEPFNIFSTTFGWAALNRIYKGDGAEGAWVLSNWDAENVVGLLGAGQGKVKGYGTYWTGTQWAGDCKVILSSMSGNFAGFLLANSEAAGCHFCGGACTAWQLCRFCAPNLLDPDLTAAYGSWKIKYNSSASKKLRKTGLITSSYSFKKAGNSAELMKKVEAAAKKGELAAAATDDDWDDDDDDYDYEDSDWAKKYAGEVIAAADVGAKAYAEGETDGEAPEAYDGSDNLFVLAILGLEEDDAS